VLTTGLAAMAASLKPLLEINDFPTMQRFLQKYYKEMTPEDMAKVLKRIENEVEAQYGMRPHVRDLKPMDGVEFVYCLNLTRCIGCRKCVHACVAENNQSRDPEIQYIRVLRLRRHPCRRRVSSTCRCSASNARIHHASKFARSMRHGRKPTGSR
jgi:molybdopterin-containing oxidoreductase family iron-sulfur binding subunit